MICLSSLVSSGNFLLERRPLKATITQQGAELEREEKGGLTDLFEVIGDVCGEDHFDNDLAHVPVLRFRQQLKNVILGVKKQLESDRTMMVLED